MKNTTAFSTLLRPSIFTFAAACLLAGTPARADCPFESPFGPDDEIGASQTQTPEKVLEAIKLIETGRVFGLAHVMAEATVPLPFGRVYDNGMFTFDFAAPPANPTPQRFNQGPIVAFMGQLATQIDALGHAGHPTEGFYNCIPTDEVRAELNNSVDSAFPNGFAFGLPTGFLCDPPDGSAGPLGCVPNPQPTGVAENAPGENEIGQGELQKLGVETIKPFFTRGVLIDLKNYLAFEGKAKGDPLPASYVVTLDDVLTVIEAQLVDPPDEGDAVVFYTGWDERYGTAEGNAELITESPGIGLEVAEWLVQRGVAIAGADNIALEALDGDGNAADTQFPDNTPESIADLGNGMPFPAHFRLLTTAGIHILELMKLTEFADEMLLKKEKQNKKNAYQFVFVYSAVPLKGMGGSPGRPLAID